MAQITKIASPSLASLLPNHGSDKEHPDLVAGENLGAWDACYINANGMVYKATGAAANAAARVRGWCPDGGRNAGEAVTLLRNCRVEYGSGLTPGTDLYLSGTVAGGLADAASTGGTEPIGYVVTPTLIFVKANQ